MFVVAGKILVHELKRSLAKGTRISSALPIANTPLVYAVDPNYPDAGAVRDLQEDREEAVEFGAAGYLYFVDQCRDKAVRVLQGRCYWCQVLLVNACAPAEPVFHRREVSAHCFPFDMFTYEFVIHLRNFLQIYVVFEAICWSF